ncbi:hypothetical protein CEXT_314671 [Caerostris extrusa]|uniref:Uncharacterized protein n=1 Tax=Caerostris extrusa TaxID=172846 RepID=A0AAV4Q3X0_CAEEX|nr:hypothetical protein CEXT_314671 [Caerostris extrusa]
MQDIECSSFRPSLTYQLIPGWFCRDLRELLCLFPRYVDVVQHENELSHSSSETCNVTSQSYSGAGLLEIAWMRSVGIREQQQ